MMFFRLAWRNVWRNRRRSLITVSAIAFGLAVLIVFYGIGRGFHEQMIENSIRTYTGHLQIHAKGFQDSPTIERSMAKPDEPLGVIQKIPDIQAYTARIQAPGLISSSDHSSGALIIGIDPVAEAQVSVIRNRVIQGEFLKDAFDKTILIGEKMSRDLKVGLDDKVVLMVQARDGSMGAEAFRVKGIFQTGSPQMDGLLCFISLNMAQDLFVLEGGISQWVLCLSRQKDVDRIQAQLRQTLPDERYEVLSWKELSPEVVQFVELDEASFILMILIVFIVVALGILNTLLMSIFERIREFGIMMAMGMRPYQVSVLIFIESLLLGLVSVIIGSILGFVINSYFQHSGIDLSQWGEGITAVPYLEPVVFSRFNVMDLVHSIEIVLLTTLVATIYPALKAARLKPVDAMRHV
ncbi:MAG: ABC transporter permease [Chlamydiota bacterium]|nr:ABC transporter permease [Chlamydiota bacterium]